MTDKEIVKAIKNAIIEQTCCESCTIKQIEKIIGDFND